MKLSVNWLSDYIKMKPPIEGIADRLTMAGLEVEKVEAIPALKDHIFQVEVTTNRPDWLSHIGVAREIAAVENISMKLPEVDNVTNRPMPSGWKLDLKENDGCPYYTGVLIEGIQHNETPEFIRQRLEACGVRCISLIVDITNYVLLETGQPLHAFDADLLKFQEIKIRRAKKGEKFTAIDESVLELKEDDLVIADRDNPVALAGVMGGKDSEVNEKTRNILLESAFFNPRWIRRTSKRFNLTSESSYRFERRVDPEGVDYGRARALHLIQKYAKPRFVSAVIKAGEKPLKGKTVLHISELDIEKWLGVQIKGNQIASILTRLGLNVSKTSVKSWKVGIPSFRPDLIRTVDLIEEVSRIYGFDKIPETLPERAPLYFEVNDSLKLENTLRSSCAGLGFFETVTFSLISKKGIENDPEMKNAIKIVNPQNKELAWMRPHLATSLLDVIKRNHHVGIHDVFLYEIAKVYGQKDGKNQEKEKKVLALAMFGDWKDKTWLDQARAVSFFDLKGTVETLMIQVGIQHFNYEKGNQSIYDESVQENIVIGKDCVGWIGQIRNQLLDDWDLETPAYYAQLDLNAILKHVRWIKPIVEMPKYPAIKRDISLVIQEVTKAGDIEKCVHRFNEKLIRQVEIFDLFRGKHVAKGHKKIGLRVTYQSAEKTLVSDDIQQLHTKIADTLVKEFQASFQ